MVGTAYHLRTFWDIKEDDVFWCMSDIGWVVGHSYIVYAPLVCGATTVFREGSIDYPHTGIAFEVIEKYGVTVAFTAPTAVANADEVRGGCACPLRSAIASAADLRWRTAQSRSLALGVSQPVWQR